MNAITNCIDSLEVYERVYQELGIQKDPRGFFSSAGYILKSGTKYQYNTASYTNIPLRPDSHYLSARCFDIAYQVYKANGFPIFTGYALNADGVMTPHCANIFPDGTICDLCYHVPLFLGLKREYIGLLIDKPVDSRLLIFHILYPAPTGLMQLLKFNHICRSMIDGTPIKRYWFKDHPIYRDEDLRLWAEHQIPGGEI